MISNTELNSWVPRVVKYINVHTNGYITLLLNSLIAYFSRNDNVEKAAVISFKINMKYSNTASYSREQPASCLPRPRNAIVIGGETRKNHTFACGSKSYVRHHLAQNMDL